MSNVSEYFGTPLVHADAYGVEMEMESFVEQLQTIPDLLLLTEDGSLRNNGREFISKPVNRHHALSFYKKVMDPSIVLYSPSFPRCTDRGSVHVHVNMSHRDLDDVRNLILLYCLLEPGFFSLVDETRQNNIYCVPLSSTRMPTYAVSKSMDMLTDVWHKYTAFNVKPLSKYGTIEFRHLQATEDINVFDRWLHTLEQWSHLTVDALTVTRPRVVEMFKKLFHRTPTSAEQNVMENLFLTVKLAQHNLTSEVLQQRIKENKSCAV